MGGRPPETAHKAGFADHAHFTRTFNAAFGLTPGRHVGLCAGQRRQRSSRTPVSRTRRSSGDALSMPDRSSRYQQ